MAAGVRLVAVSGRSAMQWPVRGIIGVRCRLRSTSMSCTPRRNRADGRCHCRRCIQVKEKQTNAGFIDCSAPCGLNVCELDMAGLSMLYA